MVRVWGLARRAAWWGWWDAAAACCWRVRASAVVRLVLAAAEGLEGPERGVYQRELGWKGQERGRREGRRLTSAGRRVGSELSILEGRCEY